MTRLPTGSCSARRTATRRVLAEAICTRFPSIDLVRFCNSGTEANLLALTLARAVTARSGVLVFAGAYHGGILLFSHGVSPLNPPFDWVVGEYNDAAGAARLVEEHAHHLAAVIVEPLQGAAGVIPGDPAFLHSLREATAANDVLLVFDEVMTARLSLGGMQQLLGIEPDLTTLAKFVGGGLSFGAFGGRADLLGRFDPSRPDALQHGGTFNNDVLTMAAGAAGMTKVLTEDEIRRLNGLGDRLRDRLNAYAEERDVHFCATGYGSLVGLHFTRGPVHNEDDVPDPQSSAASFTCTCSSAASRTGGAASSRSRSRSARRTSTASPQRSRTSCRPVAPCNL